MSKRSRGPLKKGIYRRGRAEGISKLNFFILVVNLRWLEHSRDTHRKVPLLKSLTLHLGLLLLKVQISIIPREFLERDKKITECEFETIWIGMKFSKARNETLDLCAEERKSRFGIKE